MTDAADAIDGSRLEYPFHVSIADPKLRIRKIISDDSLFLFINTISRIIPIHAIAAAE